MNSIRRVLTGIKPTGTPHIGNYVGAIRPAIAASRQPGVESFYFLADWHALVSASDLSPEKRSTQVWHSTLEIAASWLACGLDPEVVLFYRQSDIPEIPELNWLLTCATGKGLLNRAHAYKAAVDTNVAAGLDPDTGVNAGLYMYPVLMAADILMFNAHAVPVGRDQVQHIEIARDLAQRFNHLYGREYFTLPEALVDESTSVLPGLDGRKMSKSYYNVIPLWAPREDLRKAIKGIVTNSQARGERKDPDTSHLFTLYQAFASPEEVVAMRRAYADGIAWGEAKEALFTCIDSELADSRERYHQLTMKPERIEEMLAEGASRARVHARRLMSELRDAVGIRSLANARAALDELIEQERRGTQSDWSPAEFTSPYGRHDGFRFRILYGSGEQYLIAERPDDSGFPSAREAGLLLKRLKSSRPDELDVRLVPQAEDMHELCIYLDNVRVARGSAFSSLDVARAARAQLSGALKAASDAQAADAAAKGHSGR